MTRKERNEIIKFAEKLTDGELEDYKHIKQWKSDIMDSFADMIVIQSKKQYIMDILRLLMSVLRL